MNLLSYGDSIAEGDYLLHSVFASAVNFSRGRVIVSLVTPAAGDGPQNLVLRRLPAAVGKLRSTKSAFYLGARRLPKAPAVKYDSSVPHVMASPALVRQNIMELRSFLAANASAKSMCFIFSARAPGWRPGFESLMRRRMEKAVRLLKTGKYGAGAKRLRGLGFGLTPSGDDFLSGMLAGLNFAGGTLGLDTGKAVRELYGSCRGGNLISNSFLHSSYKGRVAARIKRLIRAICAGDRREFLRAAAGALKSGHTSGADFCAGFVFSLTQAPFSGQNTATAAPPHYAITGKNK